MADTTGQMHPHYRTAVKAAGAAALGLAAAVFAAVNPGDARMAGIAAGCVALYAGARWGAKKLGLRGSLRGSRMPSLRRSTGAGGSRGRASLFKRSSGGGKALGGARRGGALLRGRGGLGKMLPKMGRGGSRKSAGPSGKKSGRGGLFRRSSKNKGAAGAAAGPRSRGLLRRGGKGSLTGKGSAPGRRGLNPLRRPGRKGGSGGKPSRGSSGRGRFLPKLGKRSGSGGGSSGRAGLRLGGAGKGGSLFRRGSGRSFSPFKRRSGGGMGGSGRGPGIFRRGARAAGGSRGPGIFRRRNGGKGTGAAGASRPGGMAAGLRRYAKAGAGRKLNRWQRGALGVGKLAAAPFALAWLGGRWAWRKARKRPAQAGPEPVPKAAVRPKKQQPAEQPVPDAAPENPGRAPVRLHNFTEGPTIMNHIDAATEAAQAHIGGWEPENADDLDLFLKSLPAYFDGVAGAFRTVAAKLADGYPVHPDIPERLNEIASTIGGMADFSGEAHAAHRAQHQQELERLENPRPNEKFWDVSAQ